MEKISQNIIKQYAKELPYSFSIHDCVDSTNTYAKKLIISGCNNKTVVIAESQTNGRGRVGREFFSPADNGIYMSVILKTDSILSDINLLTVAVSVVTLNAIEKMTGLDCGIKWVNDIFVDNKKVCGILCESVSKNGLAKISHVIIGIGINVKTTDFFPCDLKNIAGALKTENLDRNELIAEILKGIENICQAGDLSQFLDEYRKKSIVLYKNISFIKNGTEYSGRVLSINEYGNLEVELIDKKIITIKSGEIRLDINSVC